MSLIKAIKIDPFAKTVSMVEAEAESFKAFATTHSSTGFADFEKISNDAVMWMQYGTIATENQAFFVHPARVGPVCGIAFVTGLEVNGVCTDSPVDAALFEDKTRFVDRETAGQMKELVFFMRALRDALEGDCDCESCKAERESVTQGEQIIRSMFH